jgi:hypothetical protein
VTVRSGRADIRGVNDFFLVPEVSGHRDADQPFVLPDVRLTADEFLHWQAICGETVKGAPPAHGLRPGTIPTEEHYRKYVRGQMKPGCEACESIMRKAGAMLREAERVGVAPW